MITDKFSKIFSRFLRGTMLSTVALTAASFGLNLYDPGTIIAPAHAAPHESQEQLEELKNYTPPPMFTSDAPVDSDGDNGSADEPPAAPAPTPTPTPAAGLPLPTTETSSDATPVIEPVPPTATEAPNEPLNEPLNEPPRVKIISTTNKTYDAIPRATITTLPAPAAAPTPAPTVDIAPDTLKNTPPKSSEKIYDAPPKEWLNNEEDRTAGMTRPHISDAAQKEISDIKTSKQQTPALSAGKLPNILPEDILSHPTENNHVLTLRAQPEDALPLPSNPPKPAKLSTPAKLDSPEKITSPGSPPATAKTAPPEKIENPQISTAPPIPDHKPAVLPKIVPEKINQPAKAAQPAKAQEPPKTEIAPAAPPPTAPTTPKALAPIASPTASPLQQFSLEFSPAATDLTADQRELLLQNVIKTLTQNSQLRVQILSYAGRVDGSESSARRISLSRALAVRSYLLENKIAPARIDVRALSDNTPESPADRMDLEFTK